MLNLSNLTQGHFLRGAQRQEPLADLVDVLKDMTNFVLAALRGKEL